MHGVLRLKVSSLRGSLQLNFWVKIGIPAFIITEDIPDLQRLRKAASRIEGKLFPVACSMGYNDIAWVKHELDIPTFSRGIQREGCNVHSFDENVPIKNIKIAIEDLIKFLSKNP
jgi:di/tripeptidase